MSQAKECKTDWTGFWTDAENSRFTKVSWSKRRIIRILERFIQPGAKVLDAGCGSGFFSNYFTQQQCETYALDYSPKALEIARKITDNKCKDYIARDLLDPNMGREFENQFDLIFTDGLFEHFSEVQQQTILDNFIQMKKPSGVIVTVVPHLYSWWTVVRPLFMPQIEEQPFTLNRLKRMHHRLTILEEHGLSVLPIGLSPEGLGKRCGMLLCVVGQ